MPKPKVPMNIRSLFITADSVSIDDQFIRYPNPEEDDEFEVYISGEDDRYEFSCKSLDEAKLDDGVWSLYCDYNKQHVDICFYKVEQIK